MEKRAPMEYAQRQSIFRTLIVLLLALASATSCMAAPAAPVEPKSYLLHLPGIGGTKGIDRRFVAGLEEGGFDGISEIYDWTENDPGIDALLARARNNKQAKLISEKIAAQSAAAPHSKIFMSCHSGGGGIAIWALEDLPENVKIESLVMMSPALSPNYDLTPALKHVTGHVYMFSSLADIFILSTGTKLFGTIDGVKTDAAGRIGFSMPANADAEQYKKLVQLPYRTSWTKYGNMADHIGGMNRSFGKNIVAPLFFFGKMPVVEEPTTQAVK